MKMKPLNSVYFLFLNVKKLIKSFRVRTNLAITCILAFFFFFTKRRFKTKLISLFFISNFRFSLVPVSSHRSACLCFHSFDHAVPFRFSLFSTRTLISFNFFILRGGVEVLHRRDALLAGSVQD